MPEFTVEAPEANPEDQFLPARQFTDEMRYEAEKARQAEVEDVGTLQIVKDAIDSEWLGAWALRSMNMPEFDPDPEFSYDALDEKQREEIFGGLSPEEVEMFSDRLSEATSFAHAQAIRGQLEDIRTVQQRLQDQGLTGTAARVTAAILDPVAIGATVATEGVAAPAIWGTRLSRLQRAIRTGALAGTINAGVEGAIAQFDPYRDLNDVVIAGATGLVLGGAVGGTLGKSAAQVEMDRALAENAHRLIDDITIEEGIEQGLTGATPKQVVTTVTDEGEIVTQETAGETGKSFGGNVSAAFNPYVEDFTSKQVQDKFALAEEYRPVAGDVTAQWDMYSQMARSKHPMVAFAADLLTPNPSGIRTTGRPQAATAWESSVNIFNTEMTRVNRSFNQAFKGWAKENGVNWVQQIKQRDDFAKAVGRTVRDPNFSTDKYVKQAADAIRETNRNLLEMAKKAGVRGFDEVPENSSYLMRVHSLERWSSLRERFGDATIDLLLTRAIMRGSADLDEEAASAIAAAYRRTVDRAGWGVDQGSSTMFSNDQREWLRELLTKELKEAGQSISDEQIEDMLYITQRDNMGKSSRAKRRLGLDETYSMRVRDPQTGQQETLSVQDLFEDHAEVIMQSYVRQMSGIIGMARQGFKGQNDFDNWVNDIRKSASKVPGYSKQKMEEELAVLETLKKGVLGQPLADLNRFASMRRAGRMLRDYNFARVMGKVGFAQIAEIGNVLGQFGMRATLRHVPALRKVFKRIETGELDDQLARELEAMVAPGTDRILQNPLGRFDDMDIPELRTANKVDKGLHLATRTVADISFMHPINIALERMGARAAVQRFADMATGKGRKLSKKRLLSLGLNDETAERVFAQMRKHVGYTEGPLTGKRVKTLNLDEWDDPVARDAFVFGIQRWMRRAIQKNDIGDLAQFMTTDVGKIIFQFRSFMMVSWAKQTIHGVRMADFETYASFLGSLVFGGIGYALMAAASAAGRDDAQDYLRERLNPTALGSAAFYRAGWASILPVGIDTGAELYGSDPIFAHARTTGMSAGAFFGNPSVDLLNQALKATRGATASALNPDYQFSEKDYNALTRALILQNANGVQNGLQMLGDALDLPESSK
ncbi:hypothetical protein GTQ45_02000 [Pyruvatibacter mobilis]|uniref:Internal virion protein n=1 Tax=Pyruvatibacter mobilis TaxID=1712261 RepID=A0A845Q7T6_9HYPH|nr:hypothetical protein [Pyruvatibacter mobilis]NBG94504.1 hypothetical protein [Pyruvatibacter mobilis]QJD74024.1 hypothetical protein HG718_00550 [Pyruvatibacter mobilis]